MGESPYQFRPDVYEAVVAAIPLICRAKKDVITFFRGAGLRHPRLDELAIAVRTNPDAVRKHDMAHELLALANEDATDTGLKIRREILKSIVDFNNFDSCWQGDQLKARGAVTKVRELVDEKNAFARMSQAYDRERSARLVQAANEADAKRKKLEAREAVKKELYSVIMMPPGRERGHAFGRVLNKVFALDGLLVREAFELTGEAGEGVVEQIDGVVELDNHLYLAEAKFWSEKLGVGDVSQHMVRVAHRGEMRGIFVVYPGYSEPAIVSVRAALQRGVFVLCTVEELVNLFEDDASILEWLRAKVRYAMLDRDPHRLYQRSATATGDATGRFGA